jgi:hypothetical protein
MFTLCALSETIRLAEQLHDLRMMSEAIKQGGGQAFIAKDLNPIRELEIGGDDQGEAFVKFRAESKEGLRTVLGEGDKTEFIQNDQVKFESSGNEAM